VDVEGHLTRLFFLRWPFEEQQMWYGATTSHRSILNFAAILLKLASSKHPARWQPPCSSIAPMQSEKTSKKSSKWPLLLAEIEAVWSKRGVDVVGASDSRELITRFQRAGLSEKRSSREVEEMLRRFDEKIRLAA